MTPALLAVLLYMLVQFGIGVWVSRRISSEEDYLVAGRRLGYTLATFSIFATWFGAETVIGSAGTTYDEGVSLASAEPFGYGLCLILGGLVYAVPLWRRKLTTLADLFRTRYSVGVERLAAIILIPGSIFWAAAQVRAFGHVLSTTTTALDADTAILIAAGFTILYTAFGGLLADAITDLIQGILLVVGILVLAVAVVVHVGGADAAVAAIGASGQLRLTSAGEGGALGALEAWAIPVFGSLITTEIVGRIVATRTPEVARRSSLMAGGMYIAIGLVPVLLGLIGPGVVAELAEPEQLLPALARELLPTVLYALFAGGVISAILSTVDSTLLVSSGLLSHNLIVPLFGVRDERAKVLIARVGVLALGLVAYLLALRATRVSELVEEASAFGSAGTVVAVTFALFTKLGGPRTAAATLVVGMLAYIIGTYGGFPYPFLGALGASLATYLVGSLLEARMGRG